jgi:hypothetical protein
VLLTKDGVAYAALVPVDAAAAAAPAAGPGAETRATWGSPRFQELLARSRADSAAGREQPLEDVVRELGLTPGGRGRGAAAPPRRPGRG